MRWGILFALFSRVAKSRILPKPFLIEDIPAQAVLADKGYDSNEIVEAVTASGSKVVIPPKKNRTTQRECDFALYAERHRIECFFSKLKHYRGIATRYCKRGRNFSSLIYLAASLIYLAASIIWLR